MRRDQFIVACRLGTFILSLALSIPAYAAPQSPTGGKAVLPPTKANTTKVPASSKATPAGSKSLPNVIKDKKTLSTIKTATRAPLVDTYYFVANRLHKFGITDEMKIKGLLGRSNLVAAYMSNEYIPWNNFFKERTLDDPSLILSVRASLDKAFWTGTEGFAEIQTKAGKNTISMTDVGDYLATTIVGEEQWKEKNYAGYQAIWNKMVMKGEHALPATVDDDPTKPMGGMGEGNKHAAPSMSAACSPFGDSLASAFGTCDAGNIDVDAGGDAKLTGSNMASMSGPDQGGVITTTDPRAPNGAITSKNAPGSGTGIFCPIKQGGSANADPEEHVPNIPVFERPTKPKIDIPHFERPTKPKIDIPHFERPTYDKNGKMENDSKISSSDSNLNVEGMPDLGPCDPMAKQIQDTLSLACSVGAMTNYDLGNVAAGATEGGAGNDCNATVLADFGGPENGSNCCQIKADPKMMQDKAPWVTDPLPSMNGRIEVMPMGHTEMPTDDPMDGDKH